MFAGVRYKYCKVSKRKECSATRSVHESRIMTDALDDDLKDLNIQLSELGAIIINSDGTMSKIANWHELTTQEQVKALRVIAKRNARRKMDLEAAAAGAGEGEQVAQSENTEVQEGDRLMIEDK